MTFDISLAGWLLSVTTFLLGTILPFLYSRLSFDGFSIKQIFDLQATVQDEQNRDKLAFCIILKMANVQKASVLIDAIRVDKQKIDINGVSFDYAGHEIRAHQSLAEMIHLPPSSSAQPLDYLPLVLKADDEKILAFAVNYKCSEKERHDTSTLFHNYVARNGLRISFRVNGRYRNYQLHLPPNKDNMARSSQV
jgi:hypothetical protein